MHEFRILGSVDALIDGRSVDLGGQRQRALLAALLVHHGQVLATDRLVELLWGESAPKTATTSLQNAVSQLRRALGADVVETRAPGYVFTGDPQAIDAVRFETLLAQARGAPPAERAELLRGALSLWRGPPLADLAGEELAQAEIRRLEELRLDALEERIAADVELGLHREVIAEVEALTAAAPLRERLCELRMLALYRSGRQAEALQAFREARAAFVEELGIEPGAALQELHARILRQDAGLAGPGRAGTRHDLEDDVVRALVDGRVVPVLGVRDAAGLEGRLVDRFAVPDAARGALGRVTQYVAAMQGIGPLQDELREICDDGGSVAAVHHLLARLPAVLRERGAPMQLIVTAAFDCGVERAFADAAEELDVVTFVGSGPQRGRFLHLPAGGEPRIVDVANAYTGLSPDHRTVLLRLRGVALDQPGLDGQSPVVVTEDDHIVYPGPGELESAIPVTLTARLRRSHMLFLGYDLADWNLRLVVDRLRGAQPASYASWAVRAGASPLELAFWRRLDVQAVDVDENAFAELLDARVEALVPA